MRLFSAAWSKAGNPSCPFLACCERQIKEAETVCRILSQLTRLLRLDPKSLETHGASLKRVCEQQNIKCPALAKAVISLYLEVSGVGIVVSLPSLER